ncbi:MAG TPA: alpha/beta hydrolase [Thermoleophilaceae bacterium]|nr:alpha/beta hydrolase [Thermoleophilaceae bacterium]
MTSYLPERTAELHLRGTSGPLPARISWPARSPAGPPLVVLCPGGGTAVDTLEQKLCAVGMLVICARSATTLERAATVLEWVADHGEELGGDPQRLLVAGAGPGAELAAALVVHARENGWPPIDGQVLLR